MKHTLVRAIKAFTLAGSILLASSYNTLAADFVSVVKDGVNVRTGPGTGNPVYMELFKGYPLKVVESKGEWLKIKDFENDSGWIHSSLVENGNSVIVNASSHANMRSGPGTKNPVIANIERGVVLELIERKGKWVKVKHLSGTQGWIYAPLVWP